MPLRTSKRTAELHLNIGVMLMKLPVSLTALAFLAMGCAGTDLGTATESVTSDDTAVFAVRADTNTCAFPACGGYYVSRVNRTTTTCADGTDAAECYVAELDFSSVGLTTQQETDLRASVTTSALTVSSLFRGKILKRKFGTAGTFGRLAITVPFVSPAPVTLDSMVYKMSTIGGNCTNETCPTIREVELNTSVGRLVSHLDLTGTPGTATQKNEALVAAYSTDSMLTLGTQVGGSTDRVFTATSYFTPVDPGETLCGTDFTDELSAVTDGFLWMSESDYPVDPVMFPGEGSAAPTAEQVRALVGLPAGTSVDERSMVVFQWAGRNDLGMAPEETALAMRYRALRKVLEHNLTDLRFYYYGTIQVQVYIVGRTRCGDLAGMHTVSIET
ncbi:Hypothetical protein A7982_03773 [Minicystis rosea]|nr:Hypothetical protein A7982_03773 [Minicystis rosea]